MGLNPKGPEGHHSQCHAAVENRQETEVGAPSPRRRTVAHPALVRQNGKEEGYGAMLAPETDQIHQYRNARV